MNDHDSQGAGRATLVQDYYGRVLQGSSDLKTTACCPPEALPAHLRAIVARLEDEVVTRFYGCGSPIPPALQGARVLDLGCGSGRDAYVMACLAGPDGHVTGVDMTPEQLAVARRHVYAHMQTFGFPEANVRFLEGSIEDLAALGLTDGRFDLVTSNCVLNLAADKRRVLAEALRVLKPGGELHFADIFADRRLPAAWQSDPVLVGECLAGAMYWEDFRRTMAALGVADVRVLRRSPVEIADPAILARTGPVRFESVTVRVFKLDLEDRCEDYGQLAVYRGGLDECPRGFELDDHHFFEPGRPERVCGNTAAMLGETRYAPWFEIRGDRSRHFGLFDCEPVHPNAALAATGCC